MLLVLDGTVNLYINCVCLSKKRLKTTGSLVSLTPNYRSMSNQAFVEVFQRHEKRDKTYNYEVGDEDEVFVVVVVVLVARSGNSSS